MNGKRMPEQSGVFCFYYADNIERQPSQLMGRKTKQACRK